ncbi:hypothetical protein C6503_19250 [Candidatus Poribacteria bacterium]|nr:MAG: hypothetical protein C6503_19250 [Candidatus Poribacteria bacterium]
MRKLHIKRIPGSSLIEPANRPTETFVGARSSRLSTKNTMLETIGEIVCLIASGIVGWIIYVVL